MSLPEDAEVTNADEFKKKPKPNKTELHISGSETYMTSYVEIFETAMSSMRLQAPIVILF